MSHQDINCSTSILIVQRQFGKLRVARNVFFPEIRDSGCHGSIRLVKSVCLNQFSDLIIIKKVLKSMFHIKFYRKSLNSIGYKFGRILCYSRPTTLNLPPYIYPKDVTTGVPQAIASTKTNPKLNRNHISKI